MYKELAESAVEPGGHVIVLGYPNLIEESGRWTWRLLAGNRCHRIRRADANMFRSVLGYLNEQTALAVQEASGKYNGGVEFQFLDLSRVYENDTTGRHGLCTGSPWLNGLTVGGEGADVGSNPIRPFRSFHPNQDGHDHAGAAVAEVIAGMWDRIGTQPTTGTPPSTSEPNTLATIPNDQVQLFLNMLSYGPLDEDGLLGPASTAAIQSFQADNALPATGQLDFATLDALIQRAGDQTYLVDGCGNQMPPRTDSMYLTCSLSSGLVDVQWQVWTGLEAHGTGKVFTRDCETGCVEGEAEYFDVIVEAYNPERWRCGDGAPFQIFTVRITGTDGTAWGEYDTSLYSC